MSSGTGPVDPRPVNYTPHAIFAGSIVIAVGLYFGLRRDSPPPALPPPAPTTSSTAAPASSVSPAAPPLPPSVVPPVAVTAPSARAQPTIDADVAEAIERLKQRTVKECWRPHAGEPGMPPKVKFIYSGSFDPSGVEVARGISDDRAANSPKVSACVRAFKMDLTIPPPGAYQNVNVPFEVP